MYFNVVLVLYLLVIVASEEALERFEYQGIHQGIHQVLNYKTLMVAEMVSSFSYTVYHYYVFFLIFYTVCGKVLYTSSLRNHHQ